MRNDRRANDRQTAGPGRQTGRVSTNFIHTNRVDALSRRTSCYRRGISFIPRYQPRPGVVPCCYAAIAVDSDNANDRNRGYVTGTGHYALIVLG